MSRDELADMERRLLSIVVCLAPISAYALPPVVPASLGAVAMIATTVFAVGTTFEVGPLMYMRSYLQVD
jgi:hypothetical protein